MVAIPHKNTVSHLLWLGAVKATKQLVHPIAQCCNRLTFRWTLVVAIRGVVASSKFYLWLNIASSKLVSNGHSLFSHTQEAQKEGLGWSAQIVDNLRYCGLRLVRWYGYFLLPTVNLVFQTTGLCHRSPSLEICLRARLWMPNDQPRWRVIDGGLQENLDPQLLNYLRYYFESRFFRLSFLRYYY